MAHDDEDDKNDGYNGWLPMHWELDDTDADAERLHNESLIRELITRLVLEDMNRDG